MPYHAFSVQQHDMLHWYTVLTVKDANRDKALAKACTEYHHLIKAFPDRPWRVVEETVSLVAIHDPRKATAA